MSFSEILTSLGCSYFVGFFSALVFVIPIVAYRSIKSVAGVST